MELYCRCGYPILVTAHWTGEDYVLRLRDGREGKDSEEVQRCPRCGDDLRPGDLERLPPVELHWSSWNAEIAESAPAGD
jgi:hypothetical protein